MTTNGTVIDITAALEARRAARAAAQSPEVKLAFFEAVLPLPEAPSFVPAYARPENEKRGAKYDRELSTTEIASLVRAEIKAATGKTLPRGLKVSVRSHSFSGGSAIRLRVTAVPAGLVVCNPERVIREAAAPHAYIDANTCPYFTDEAIALLDSLTAICQAYNRDNSDSSVDYFDVNFYDGRAEFAHDVRNASKAAILASRAVAS